MKRGPLLSGLTDGFEPLALRAIVKQVDLRDPFSEISRWAQDKTALESLVFLDTPGLNTGFSTNDEVLRHVLKDARTNRSSWN